MINKINTYLIFYTFLNDVASCEIEAEDWEKAEVIFVEKYGNHKIHHHQKLKW